MGLEGIVSKRRNAPYRSGRTDNFVKIQMPRPPGIRRRRLFQIGRRVERDRRADRRASTRTASCAMPAASAPAITHKMASDLWKRLDALRTARPPVALPADERRKDVDLGQAGTGHRGRVCRRHPRRRAAPGLVQGHARGQAGREIVREVPGGEDAARQSAAPARTRDSQVREQRRKDAESRPAADPSGQGSIGPMSA